jgi:hypothetical protein
MQDGKGVSVALKGLKNFGFDHHARYINDKWAEIIKLDLPYTVEYLDSRIISNDFTEAVEEGIMNEKEKLIILPSFFGVEEAN